MHDFSIFIFLVTARHLNISSDCRLVCDARTLPAPSSSCEFLNIFIQCTLLFAKRKTAAGQLPQSYRSRERRLRKMRNMTLIQSIMRTKNYTVLASLSRKLWRKKTSAAQWTVFDEIFSGFISSWVCAHVFIRFSQWNSTGPDLAWPPAIG